MIASKPPFSETEADRRIAADKSDAIALIAKGDYRLANSDRRGAGAFYETALRIARGGTSVHRDELQRISRAVEEIQRGYADHLMRSLDDLGFAQAAWHPRFAEAIAIAIGQRRRAPSGAAFPQMPTAFYYPGLPEREFTNPHGFAWREEVEAATSVIRQEGFRLLETNGRFAPYVQQTADRPQGDVHGMLENRDWSTYDLTRKGAAVPERVHHCPSTYATISANVPLCDIPNRAPSIMFSLLASGSRIPPHTGMINARLICHLPLIVPGDGALRVGASTRSWVEGKLLVFDDSVEHEAWNHADADRLVLIFDIWHPDLEEIERAQIRALFTAVDTY